MVHRHQLAGLDTARAKQGKGGELEGRQADPVFHAPIFLLASKSPFWMCHLSRSAAAICTG